MRRRAGLLLALVIVALFVSSGALARPRPAPRAQDGSWSAPFLVGGGDPSSWFPDMALGPDGSVHIIWSSGTSTGPRPEDLVDLLMYRELRDGRWSEPNDIFNPGNGGFSARNSIVMGRDGRLHVVVRSGVRIDYINAPWEQAWSARAWSDRRRISGLSTPYYEALAFDDHGGLHALWTETVPDDPRRPRVECPFCSDLFYRHSEDGGATWSELVNLSDSPDGAAKPQIMVDRRGRLHAVWDEGYDFYVGKGRAKFGVYRRSDDSGQTWTTPSIFRLPNPPGPPEPTPTPVPTSTPLPGASADLTATLPLSDSLLNVTVPITSAIQQTTLVLPDGENPMVVYRGVRNDTLYFQLSRDGGATWTEQEPIPGVRARFINTSGFDRYSMAVDSAGRVHLLMVGLTAAETDETLPPRLLHLSWDGETWSPPETVAGIPSYPASALEPPPPTTISAQRATPTGEEQLELYPEWPRLLIDGGNQLHAVWFTRSNKDIFDSDNAHYQVWYSTTTINAPAATPIPLFTPSPTPLSLTPTPTAVEPTATPPDSQARNAPPTDGPPAWERPGMVTVGLALVPVLGFLLLFVGIGHFMTRRRE